MILRNRHIIITTPSNAPVTANNNMLEQNEDIPQEAGEQQQEEAPVADPNIEPEEVVHQVPILDNSTGNLEDASSTTTATVHHHYPRFRLPPPSKFTGEENVQMWLSDFKTYCQLSKIPEEDRGLLLYYNLQSFALSWACTLPQRVKSNFERLSQALLDKFHTDHARRLKRRDLQTRKQKSGETVTSYIQAMRELFIAVPKPEEEKVEIFIDNLRDDLRKFCYTKTVTTLDDAEHAAILGETLYPQDSNPLSKEIAELVDTVKQLVVTPKKPPEEEKTLLETVREISRNQAQLLRKPSSVVCYNCGRTGHIARSCMVRCSFCRKPGHNEQSCKLKRNNNRPYSNSGQRSTRTQQPGQYSNRDRQMGSHTQGQHPEARSQFNNGQRNFFQDQRRNNDYLNYQPLGQQF